MVTAMATQGTANWTRFQAARVRGATRVDVRAQKASSVSLARASSARRTSSAPAPSSRRASITRGGKRTAASARRMTRTHRPTRVSPLTSRLPQPKTAQPP